MMKKRLVIFLLVLLSFQLPLHTYSVKGSTPCPVDTSPDEWKLQWTYPKAKRIINLKELYIKEDENYVYFRFTSYQRWRWDVEKEFAFGVFMDIDCNNNTGLTNEGCHPLGDEVLIGFHFKKNKVSEAFIGVYNADTAHFERQYNMKPEEYSLLQRSLTFSVPKEYISTNTNIVCFDYIVMLLYNYSETKSEADVYPECYHVFSYPTRVYPVQ